VSDSSHCFRYIGSGRKASHDGPYSLAAFSYPSGVAGINATVTVVSDYGSHTLRILRLDSEVVETVIGTENAPGWQDGNASEARLNHPMGLAQGRSTTEILIADGFNHRIRSFDLNTMVLSTLAGTGFLGARDGPLNSSEFHFPSALAVHGQYLYITDMYNNALRLLNFITGQVSTLVDRLAYPMGVGLIPGTAYIAISDQLRHRYGSHWRDKRVYQK
jgi:hypothetical protein